MELNVNNIFTKDELAMMSVEVVGDTNPMKFKPTKVVKKEKNGFVITETNYVNPDGKSFVTEKREYDHSSDYARKRNLKEMIALAMESEDYLIVKDLTEELNSLN